MVGRKPSIPKNKIEEEVFRHTIYDDQFRLKGKNDKVWKEISSVFKDPNDPNKEILLPKTFYLMVRQDRNKLKTNYEKEKGIVFKNVYEVTDGDCQEVCCAKNDCDEIDNNKIGVNDEFDEGDDSIDSEEQTIRDDVLVSDNKREFQIILIQAEWECIKPKQGPIMQEGWGDFLMDKVWEKTKIPCAYNFDNHRIGKAFYFSAQGICSECNSLLSISLITEPTDGDVHMEVCAENVKFGVPHNKCRRLAGPKRRKVKEQLLHELPRNWRRKEADNLMDIHDPNPPHLYKLPSLQKARLEAKNEQLGILKEPLFESLDRIKANHRYGPWIRQIGYNSFFVCWWSQDQVDLHNDILKDLGNSFSADATGSICTSIKRPGQKSKHNFFTILTTNVENKIVVTCQLLSERNDANLLAYWLREFLRSGARKPGRMVTDKGQSLRNGICLAMNNVTFKQYNNMCLLILQNKMINVLDTQMASDISHLVHLVELWPKFTKMPSKVQLLYRHCISILSTIEELKHFEIFFKAVITLAFSKTSNSQCIIASRFIIDLIKTFEFDDVDSKITDRPKENEDVNEDMQLVEENYQDDNEDDYMKIYIKELVDSIGLQNLTDNEFLSNNDFYYPEFGDRFIELCHEFPWCTNVMLQSFGIEEKVATSSRSENIFRDIKDTCLNSRVPIRQDKFIIRICDIVESDVKMRRSELENLKKQRKNEQKRNYFANKKSIGYLLGTDRWKRYGQTDVDEESEQQSDQSITQEGNQQTEVYTSSNAPSCHNIVVINNNDTTDPIEQSERSIIEEKKQLTVVYNSSHAPSCHDIAVSNDNSITDPTNQRSAPVNLNKECTDSVGAVEIDGSHSTDQEKANKIIPRQQPRKRGFYVSPNPDIELNLQMPKRNKKEVHVIQNGLIKGGKKSVHGIQYRFKNTCPWDSVTEVVTYSCNNSSSFNDFVTNSQDKELALQYKCYLTTVTNYSRMGLTQSNSLYTSRAYQLLPVAQKLKQVDELNEVDCTCNPNNLFNTLMAQYDCSKEIGRCTLCRNEYTRKTPVTPLPNTSIVENDYQTLEEELSNYFYSKRVYYCQECQGLSMVCSRSLGPYLWLDVEDAYKSLNKDIPVNITTNLLDIPVNLTIHNQNFILCGAIEFRPGHFVAYCYDAHYKYWVEKNDLNECSIKHFKNINRMKINSILYVKWS